MERAGKSGGVKHPLLITAALPYANGPLHFGHIAGAYPPADVHARFRRLCGEDVLYLCGSDEHGIAITLSAEQAGRSPQEHVDHYHALIQEMLAAGKARGIDFYWSQGLGLSRVNHTGCPKP